MPHNWTTASRMQSRIALVIATVAVILLFATTAFSLATQVIPASDLRKRVPMTALFYLRDSFNPPVCTPDFVITQDEHYSKLVRGRDKSGKPWQVVLPAPTHGLWETHLNGTRTYYFAGYTGGAGMAPSSWLLVISFDERGRPVPFYITGYGTFDGTGISDILNLDGTGPELLQQNWVETHWMPDARSGYYITTLYEQRGAYWYRADGQHGTRTFPLYEKWAMLPNTQPQLAAAPASSSLLSDYGNDPGSGIRAKILSLDQHGIHVGSELGCELEFIDLVVEDSKEGRQIEAGYFYASSPGALLPDIARNRLSATFTGVNRWPGADRCVASTVWASKE